MNDEPTEPLAPVPALPSVEETLFATGEASPPGQQPAGTGGAHRRDDDGAERRWPWLAALGGLAVLGFAGLGLLLANLPQPEHRRAAPSVSPTPTSVTSPGDTTTEPPPTATAAATSATPTSTPSATSPVSTRTVTPSPTPVRTTPVLPRQVQVPNVVGKRAGAATAVLRAAGFSVTSVPAPTGKRRDIGRVVSQAPAGGSSAPRGSAVTIFVGVATPS